MEVGSYHLCVGIAADTLRNGGNCTNHADALSLIFYGGGTNLNFDGKQITVPPLYFIMVQNPRKGGQSGA